MGDEALRTAATLLRRLRAGDRLDQVARDYGTSVSAIRQAFLSIGIDRQLLQTLRSTEKTPVLRLPEDLLQFVDRRRASGRGAERKPAQRWSEGAMLASLELASTMAFPLTAKAYEELRDERQVIGPSSLTIANRFGTWAKACEAADVECGAAPRDSYTRSWTNYELVSFVKDYLQTTYAPSVNGYAQWAAQTDGAPSFGTIRNRLGSWSRVKFMALQASEDPHRRARLTRV